MTEQEKKDRHQLLIEFNDLFNRETRLMGQARTNKAKREELAQVSDQVEALRERIAQLSIDTVEVGDA